MVTTHPKPIIKSCLNINLVSELNGVIFIFGTHFQVIGIQELEYLWLVHFSELVSRKCTWLYGTLCTTWKDEEGWYDHTVFVWLFTLVGNMQDLITVTFWIPNIKSPNIQLFGHTFFPFSNGLIMSLCRPFKYRTF